MQALSMPHVGLVLPEPDAALIAGCEGTRRALDPSRFSLALRDGIDTALRHFRDGVFLRLGGRSFVTEGRGPQRVTSLAQALEVLVAPGDRAARMARRCLLAGRPVWLFARAWRAIDPSQEFRLWIHQGRLVAASQHHHRHCFPEVVSRGHELAGAVEDFARRLCPRLHLTNVVADVWIAHSLEPTCELIELNPAMSATGRALLGDGPLSDMPRALHLLRQDGGIALFELPG